MKFFDVRKICPSFYQYLATITGSLSIVVTGMHFGWPSPSIPILLHKDSHIPMSSGDGSWMAVMPCIGAVFGAMLSTAFVDRIGRKWSMLITSPLYFIAWIVVAYSPSVVFLNSARLLAGVADGFAFTALPMYLGEIADSKHRGLLGSSITVCLIFGHLLINIIGSYFDIKTAALIASVVPIIHFFTFCFMPASPYFLIMRGKTESAKESLRTFRGTEDVEDEFLRQSEAVAEDTKNSGSIWDLFTVKSNRKAVYIIVGLRGFQQFSGNTVITFYAKSIFQEAGEEISSSMASIIFFSLQVVVALISSFLLDRLGRKLLLVVSLIGTGLTLTAEGIYFYLQNNTQLDLSELSYVPLIALLVYVVIFNIGMGTVPVVMLSELFPTNVKAFALCLADIYFGVLVTIASKFFQIVTDNFGIHVPFFAFTVSCVVGLFFTLAYVPETKGKTLEDIQKLLKGEEPKNSTEEVARA